VPGAGHPPAGAAGDAAAGKALFVKNCALCHNADSKPFSRTRNCP
jgi:mono/diheme cytochrome c family protein